MCRGVSCGLEFWRHLCKKKDGRRKDRGVCELDKCMVCGGGVMARLGGVVFVVGGCGSIGLGFGLLGFVEKD
jgi:hypothetical protein